MQTYELFSVATTLATFGASSGKWGIVAINDTHYGFYRGTCPHTWRDEELEKLQTLIRVSNRYREAATAKHGATAYAVIVEHDDAGIDELKLLISAARQEAERSDFYRSHQEITWEMIQKLMQLCAAATKMA